MFFLIGYGSGVLLKVVGLSCQSVQK